VQTPQCKNFDKKFLDILKSFLPDAGEAHCSQGELVCITQKGFFFLHLGIFHPRCYPGNLGEDSVLEKWNNQRLEFQRITAQQTQGLPEVELRLRSLAHTIHN
jgi:hypothetical protein